MAGMPEESAASLRKLRALLTSGPRLPAWSAQLAGPEQLPETVRDLTRTFLGWVLHCRPVQSVKVVPWAGVRRGAGPPPGRRPHRAGEGRAGGSRTYRQAVSNRALKLLPTAFLRRLAKLNSVLARCPPLKPWAGRGAGEVRARLEVELTARRALAVLSGGDLVPLLRDILYPREAELLAGRYRAALSALAQPVRCLQPKQKVYIYQTVCRSQTCSCRLRCSAACARRASRRRSCGSSAGSSPPRSGAATTVLQADSSRCWSAQ